MKKHHWLIAVAVIVAGYFVWQKFNAPKPAPGPTVQNY